MQLVEKHIIKSGHRFFDEIDALCFAFTGRPKLPKYKDKAKGRNLLIYTVQALGLPALRKGLIKLSGTQIEFPTLVDKEQICQVRIVPKCDCYVIEVIYDQQESPKAAASSPAFQKAGECRLVQSEVVASIDLGLNNLATLTSNQKGFVPLLINGRTLKSINQFYNKRKAQLQSKLKGNCKTSPRIQRLTRSRNQKVDNYLYHTSHFVVDCLVENQIKTLIIGKNAQWKTEINLGKQTNQNFVAVPHSRFIEMLTYKCDLVGIKVSVVEESYTSKASFLNGDFIPTFGDKDADSVVFSGKRVKRGLYKSEDGTLINADVNGSYNIIKKVIPNAFADGIGSCVVQPRRIEPLKVKAKGKVATPSRAA